MAGILTAQQCDHRTLPWGMLRFQHVQAVRSVLMARYSAATANKMLSALRQTLRMTWRLGYLSADAYQRVADIQPVSGEKPESAAGRALSFGEWAALFAICAVDEGPAGVRDAALIALLKVCGLRRAEVAALQVEDYDRVMGTLRVQGIYYILNTRSQQARTAKFTPHDLRRTFAGDLLDAGADLATVQKLMGHANANTTAGYDRRGEHAKRGAVRKLHVPYVRRFPPAADVR